MGEEPCANGPPNGLTFGTFDTVSASDCDRLPLVSEDHPTETRALLLALTFRDTTVSRPTSRGDGVGGPNCAFPTGSEFVRVASWCDGDANDPESFPDPLPFPKLPMANGRFGDAERRVASAESNPVARAAGEPCLLSGDPP